MFLSSNRPSFSTSAASSRRPVSHSNPVFAARKSNKFIETNNESPMNNQRAKVTEPAQPQPDHRSADFCFSSLPTPDRVTRIRLPANRMNESWTNNREAGNAEEKHNGETSGTEPASDSGSSAALTLTRSRTRSSSSSLVGLQRPSNAKSFISLKLIAAVENENSLTRNSAKSIKKTETTTQAVYEAEPAAAAIADSVTPNTPKRFSNVADALSHDSADNHFSSPFKSAFNDSSIVRSSPRCRSPIKSAQVSDSPARQTRSNEQQIHSNHSSFTHIAPVAVAESDSLADSPLPVSTAAGRIRAFELARDYLQLSCYPLSSLIECRQIEQFTIEEFLIKQILANSGSSLYIAGSPGSGKTFCLDKSLHKLFGEKSPKLNQQKQSATQRKKNENEIESNEAKSNKNSSTAGQNPVIANSIQVNTQKLESILTNNENNNNDPNKIDSDESAKKRGKQSARNVSSNAESEEIQLRIITFNCMQLNNPNDIYIKLYNLCNSNSLISILKENSSNNNSSLHSYNNEIKTKEQAKLALGALLSPSLDSLVSVSQLKQKKNGKRVKGNSLYLIILDELDSLLSQQKNEILNNLFEWSNSINSKLLLVGISNSIDLLESSGGLNNNNISFNNSSNNNNSMNKYLRNTKPQITIIFRSYTTEQLMVIVKQRLEMVKFTLIDQFIEKQNQNSTPTGGCSRAELVCNYNSSLPLINEIALKFCCMKISQRSGDIRKCLEICNHAVERLLARVGSNKIQPNTELQVSFVRMNRILHNKLPISINEWIGQLPDHQKIILCLTALFHHRHRRHPTVSELHKLNNNKFLNYGFPPFSNENFNEMIANLQISGLIAVNNNNSVSKGNGGNYNKTAAKSLITHNSLSKQNRSRSKLFAGAQQLAINANSTIATTKSLDQLIDALDVKQNQQTNKRGNNEDEDADTDEEEFKRRAAGKLKSQQLNINSSSGSGSSVGGNNSFDVADSSLLSRPTIFHLKLIRAKELIDAQRKELEVQAVRSNQIQNKMNEKKLMKSAAAKRSNGIDEENNESSAKKRLKFDSNFQYSNPMLL